jgi:guanylate kinase
MSDEFVTTGIPIVISAASGTGKTSLCLRLLRTLTKTARSVSYTTRRPRGEEVDGRDYCFVDELEFDRMIRAGEFVEWAEVYRYRYGTSYRSVENQLKQGLDVLLDIDVQGGMQIRERLPDALLVFLLPPSMDELRRRLVNRATDSAEQIDVRLDNARQEIARARSYDYLIVNDDFEAAAEEVRAIVRAHRIRKNPPLQLLKELLRAADQKT